MLLVSELLRYCYVGKGTSRSEAFDSTTFANANRGLAQYTVQCWLMSSNLGLSLPAAPDVWGLKYTLVWVTIAGRNCI